MQRVDSRPIEPTSTEEGPQGPRKGIVSLLVLISLLVLLFTGLLVHNLPQALQMPDAQAKVVRQGESQEQASEPGPLQTPGTPVSSPLLLPQGYQLIYEQQNKLYTIDAPGEQPRVLDTPGYSYNRAIPPILTSDGELLYSGSGIWLLNIFDGTSRQVATLEAGQVFTSLVLSQDGKQVAWTTEPKDGQGLIKLYAGPLDDAEQIYQHSSTDCPCFRAYAFMSGTGKQSQATLLLTDDRGDHNAVEYGLWSLKVTDDGSANPVRLLDEDQPQGPLALVPGQNALLYSSYEGVVPPPTDGSVPKDIAAVNYANSLVLTSLGDKPIDADAAHTILPEQHELSNSAEYHWITTPTFSLDGKTLFYIEFSSDAQDPFSRHSALYTVKLNGVGAKVSASKPQLFATSNAHFIELGPWLDSHILTFYADGGIYAVDVTNGEVATLAQTNVYARIVAMLKQV